MVNPFAKATKKRARARVGLIGPSGAGKTYTGLILATTLGQRVAVIDTEHGSASKYASLFQFDVLELTEYDPRTYVRAIKAAGDAGYDAGYAAAAFRFIAEDAERIRHRALEAAERIRASARVATRDESAADTDQTITPAHD